MDNLLDSVIETEFVSISVRDPMRHRVDFWHTYVDYEISLNTNSMCFAKKTSCVRRRYNEFVWLRHSLQQNACPINVPKLLPWNPFFRMNDTEQVNQRMEGLRTFLENVIYTPLLLSDSRLHLFLQSDLSVAKIERCVQGLTRYTVAQAIQMPRRSSLDPLEDGCRASYDSDSEISAVSPYLGKTDVNLSHIYGEAVIRPVFLSAFGRHHQVWDPVWTLPFEPSLVTIEPLVTNELFTSKSMFSLNTDIGHCDRRHSAEELSVDFPMGKC